MGYERYDHNRLKEFCEKNNVELLKDYSNTFITLKSVIEGKCNYACCDKTFSKKFRTLFKTDTYCFFHHKESQKEKFEKTCLEKYGVKNLSQNESVKEKIKQTCLKKYGVEYSLQSKNVKEKKIITNLERYGVKNPAQCQEIKDKMKQTNLLRYGKDYFLQSDAIKEMGKKTCQEKYGVNHHTQTKMFRDKIIKTCQEKYGVENVSQNIQVKQSKVDTCFKNFGVDYPSQNQEVMEKCSKNAYKIKNYVFPSGKEIKLQGYEHFAFDELIKSGVAENDIINGCKNVPKIWYIGNDNKNHRHYVDIFIPNQNRCIEIKSTWTAEKKKDCIFLKQQAGKELGFQYEIWVYNAKGEKVECHL